MKKILIIGAGFLQTFLIKKAKSIGYYTLAVDADKNAPGFKFADKYAVINIVDEKACLEYAKAEKINGVLTAATDYGVLTASYIAQEMNLPGLDYEVAKVIKNKYQTRKCLFDNKVDDTKQALEVSEDTDIEEVSKIIKYPVMVKPCDGSGSRAASRVDSEKELDLACKAAMDASFTHRATIESFIFGREYGAESLVVNGEPHVLAIMKKWMTEPPYYAELGHALPSDLSVEVEDKAKACVYKALKALGINHGSVNMDLLITRDGSIHIVDIGARMGGNLIGSHIIPSGTGIDYMKAMLQSAVGDSIDLTSHGRQAVVTKLLALSPGIVGKLPNISRLENRFHVVVEHHMNEGMSIHEYHTNLDGCGYIVAVGERLDELIGRAEQALISFDQEIERIGG